MSTDKIDKLREKKLAIEAKLKAEIAKQSERERKEDTRRKILIGAMVLDKMKREPIYEKEINSKLSSYLTTERDRKLFDLEEKND